MEEEGKKKSQTKMLIAPLVSIAAFLVLVFGAGYAYFTSSITMNTANYQINMPAQTSLVCEKTDCGVTITPAMMTNTNVSTDTAKGDNTCYMKCTCSGTTNATCSYTVSLKQTGTGNNVYGCTNSGSVTNCGPVTAGEFLATATLPTGCTVSGTANTNAANYTTTGRAIATCSLKVGGTASANLSVNFKWYNLNADQTGHAGKVYKYSLVTSGGTVG